MTTAAEHRELLLARGCVCTELGVRGSQREPSARLCLLSVSSSEVFRGAALCLCK